MRQSRRPSDWDVADLRDQRALAGLEHGRFTRPMLADVAQVGETLEFGFSGGLVQIHFAAGS